MIKIGLLDESKLEVLQWDNNTVPMKQAISLIVQKDITSREMSEVIMQTSEPFTTISVY